MDLENSSPMMVNKSNKQEPTIEEISITGIAASPGICIGKAYLVTTEGVDVVKRYSIEKKHLVEETNRFKTAIKKTGDELQSLIKSSKNKFNGHASILETNQALLKDKLFYGRTLETIENERINAEWALKKVTDKLKSMFREMEDPYLKERSGEVTQLAMWVMRNLVGVESINIGKIDKRVILIASELSPAETSQINLEKIKGFITDRGGVVSHTGIIARTLEIPAVLGMGNATKMIQNDDVIVVDGFQGLVIVHPSEQTIIEYEEMNYRYAQFKADIVRDSMCDAQTTDGVNLKIMGNIELPEEVVAVNDNGGDGIGLYRTEFQYMSSLGYPTEDELFDKYKDVVEVMAPKPVTIRTLDINGDKAVAGNQDNIETNPALGLRGIRYCLQRPDIFSNQIRAILRAASFGEVRLLLPMISSCAEIEETKRVLDQAASELEKQGKQYNRDIKIGIMIEVPAAVIMADALADKVDFFSIGTNDLIQYTLAIDRGNREVAHLYHPLHPAVLRMLKKVTQVAKDKGIEIYMCGEMAGELINIPILLGLELDELSMNPQAIPAVKCFVRSLNVGEAKTFLDEVYKQRSAKAVHRLIYERYGDLISQMNITAPVS